MILSIPETRKNREISITCTLFKTVSKYVLDMGLFLEDESNAMNCTDRSYSTMAAPSMQDGQNHYFIISKLAASSELVPSEFSAFNDACSNLHVHTMVLSSRRCF